MTYHQTFNFKDDLYNGLKSHKVLWRSPKPFLRYLDKTSLKTFVNLWRFLRIVLLHILPTPPPPPPSTHSTSTHPPPSSTHSTSTHFAPLPATNKTKNPLWNPYTWHRYSDPWHRLRKIYSRRRLLNSEHLVVLLAGPISHTSTQYIDFVDFLHFNGSVYQLFCSF